MQAGVKHSTASRLLILYGTTSHADALAAGTSMVSIRTILRALVFTAPAVEFAQACVLCAKASPGSTGEARPQQQMQKMGTAVVGET
jgi:hypothetical protein